VGYLGDRVLARQQRRGAGLELGVERVRVGLGVARDGRLAGALEEDVGDLDRRRARPQRRERVDPSLGGVGGLDERLEVGVPDLI
jgi:hypothetical protein